MSQIREQYVNTGKVRFVYKNYPILGQDSIRAAVASECAAEEDKFWEFHDVVFADQATARSPLNDATLTSLASKAGLDMDAFSACLAANRHLTQIIQESQSIQALGVRGTPGFLINGMYIAGAQPFEIFQQIIEEQLLASADVVSETTPDEVTGTRPEGPPPAN